MAMLTLDRYLDLIIPRGGEDFVRLVAERATVPVLKHDKGLCHLYVDEGADLDMAVAVAIYQIMSNSPEKPTNFLKFWSSARNVPGGEVAQRFRLMLMRGLTI